MSSLAQKLTDNCDCPLIMHRLTFLLVLLMIVFLYIIVWFRILWLLSLHTTLIATALVFLIIRIFFAIILDITFLRVSVLFLSRAVNVVFVFIRDCIQVLMIICDIYLGHVKTTCIKIQWNIHRNLQWIRRRCLHNNIFQLFFCFATIRHSLLNSLFLQLAWFLKLINIVHELLRKIIGLINTRIVL